MAFLNKAFSGGYRTGEEWEGDNNGLFLRYSLLILPSEQVFRRKTVKQRSISRPSNHQFPRTSITTKYTLSSKLDLASMMLATLFHLLDPRSVIKPPCSYGLVKQSLLFFFGLYLLLAERNEKDRRFGWMLVVFSFGFLALALCTAWYL